MNSPSAIPAPRIRIHRAGAGLGWVQQGLRLFARHPLVLAVLVGLGPLLLLTLKVVPLLGDLASYLLTPAMGLGMLTVCRSVRGGTPAGISSYLAGLQDPVTRLRLLQLGAYYALVGGLVTLAVSVAPAPTPADGAALPPNGNVIATPPAAPAQAPGTDEATPPPVPPAAKNLPGTPDFGNNPVPLPIFIGLALIMVPFVMTIWFAPVLCGWYRMPAPKALFFSFFACWRNRAPILVYLVTLFGIWVIAVLILASLIDILNAKEGLAPYLLLAPLLFLILAIAQAANLAMVEDVIDDGRESDDTVADTTILPPS